MLQESHSQFLHNSRYGRKRKKDWNHFNRTASLRTKKIQSVSINGHPYTLIIFLAGLGMAMMIHYDLY